MNITNNQTTDEELLQESLDVIQYFYTLYDSGNDDCSISIDILNKLKSRLKNTDQK